MRKLETFKTSQNSLSQWKLFARPSKVYMTHLLMHAVNWCPSLGLKRAILRMTGMKIGKNVSIAPSFHFDFMFPELVEIGDNSIIGYGTIIVAHEFLVDSLRKGRVIIGKNVMIGANSTILAGVSVADNCIISAMTLVNKHVPAGSFCHGNPMRIRRRKSYRRN